MDLERQNPHWANDFSYAYSKKRFIFDRIRSSVESGFITGLYGLRRVGKSVILKQLIDRAVSSGTERMHILYFSFDEETEDFWEVIREYEKKIGRQVSDKSHIFLDEIQKVPDWKGKIKRLYDTSKARIILSGSNSSMLRKGTESLAGRINEFFLPELGFEEFLHFKNKADLYTSVLEDALETEFWAYLQKPFPELVLNEKLDPRGYTDSISRKVIYEDLPQVFPIDEPALLHRLFLLICRNPGMLVEFNSLASDLGRNRQTISLYLDYLRYGFLVRSLFNFTKNRLTSEKKLKKFYPSLACFADADQSKIVETMAAQTLKAKFFWNYKNRYEVDFIVAEPLYAFEVKYQNSILASDFTGLEHFASAYPDATIRMVSKKPHKDHVPYYRLEGFLKQHNLLPRLSLEELLEK